MANEYATWSKDPSTQVGCIITKSDHSVVSGGYNGLPRGANDSIESRSVRPEKYLWYEHAERNAIYNAAKSGIALNGCTAYCTLCPCMDCARGLVQTGIQRVVFPKPDEEKFPQWVGHFRKSEELFKECGVEVAVY